MEDPQPKPIGLRAVAAALRYQTPIYRPEYHQLESKSRIRAKQQQSSQEAKPEQFG
jgi:hypothetical protein